MKVYRDFGDDDSTVGSRIGANDRDRVAGGIERGDTGSWEPGVGILKAKDSETANFNSDNHNATGLGSLAPGNRDRGVNKLRTNALVYFSGGLRTTW